MKDMKEALRNQARKHRARMDPEPEMASHAADHFFATFTPQPHQSIAAYWPKGREFDPTPILERAFAAGHICALPVIQKDSKILKFARWSPEMALFPNAHDIMEPPVETGAAWVEPDILLLPLLAFDRRGGRLGQGGGYYDATLADLRGRKDICALGLGYASQAVLFPLPAEEHDQKLDGMVTEQGAWAFER